MPIDSCTVAKGRVAEYVVDVRLPGLHNRANLAAAVAGALELERAARTVARRDPGAALPRGRYDRIALDGGIHLIYDAYNANASGMIAALDAFASEAAARRIAVLAQHGRARRRVESLHERVGAHAASKVDVLLVRGEYADDLARGAQRGGLESPADRRRRDERSSRAHGCANTRVRTTSCCSRVHANTNWKRSSKSCAREPRNAQPGGDRAPKCRRG